MGKVKNTVGVISIILSSTGALVAGGGVAYNSLNQPVNGVDGVDGNVWKVGTENIETVTLGNEGDFYYDTDDYKLYQVENGSWVLKVEGFGQQGDQGIQGEQGLKGDQGQKGVQGEQGLKGDTGIQGEQGLKGDQGEQGVAGTDGEKGDQGDKGSKGDQGNPGSNGTNGTDGSTSYIWVKYSNVYPTANADMLDTASNYIGVYSGSSATAPTDFTSYTWYETKGDKGDTGDKGATGNAGNDGKTGTSIYVGYDGYAWKETTRTQFKISDLGDTCIENTLELYSNDYFEKELVDTTTKQIALTGEYYQNINKTIYDNLALDKITLYANENGNLEIGKISLVNGDVSDLITYPVIKGKNEIDLSAVSIGENQTIVLGGNNTTVQLYKAVGVEEANDSYGNFTVVGDTFTVNNSKTEDVLDKLITNVTFKAVLGVSTKLLPNVVTDAGSISSMTVVSRIHGPYKYVTNYFSGKVITKLGVAVKDSNNGTINIYRINSSQTSNFKTNYLELYTIELNCTKNSTIDAWVYTDVNIEVGENETLAFDYNDGGTGDGADWLYRSGSVIQGYAFTCNNGSSGGATLTFDVEGYDKAGVIANISTVRNKLIEAEEIAKGE